MITLPAKPAGTALRDWLLDNGISPPDVNRVEVTETGELQIILHADEES